MFHNHDSYGIRETCAELGSVISISHELCLVVAKKKITPISMELSTRRYSWWRPGGAKDTGWSRDNCMITFYALGTRKERWTRTRSLLDNAGYWPTSAEIEKEQGKKQEKNKK